MVGTIATVLRDQGRGVVGALVVSVEMLFTMEVWWHGWQLPMEWLVVYVVVGLAAVIAITRSIGFREAEETDNEQSDLGTVGADFTELLFQSFVTAYVVLLLFGVIDLDTPSIVAARLGLIFVVPLGFGAALANKLLKGAEKGGEKEWPFYRHLGTFAVGALFVSWTMSPTDEMPLVAAYATWYRLGLILVLSVLVAYLVLYELEFRGQHARITDKRALDQWGHAFIMYAVGIVIAASLLAAFGHFRGSPIAVWVQLSIVLGFPATLGASGARVVLA